MGLHAQGLELREEDKKQLQSIVHKGHHLSRNITRAHTLLKLNQGLPLKEVAHQLSISPTTVKATKKKYLTEGLENVFKEKKGRGRRSVFSGETKAKITALACSTPPEGHSDWSLRLLADSAVELGYVDHISYGGVRKILKKTT